MLSGWSLVLLLSSGPTGAASAVVQIPAFRTIMECQVAGELHGARPFQYELDWQCFRVADMQLAAGPRDPKLHLVRGRFEQSR